MRSSETMTEFYHFTKGFSYTRIQEWRLKPLTLKYVRSFKEPGFYVFLLNPQSDTYEIEGATFNETELVFQAAGTNLFKAKITGIIEKHNTYTINLTSKNDPPVVLEGQVDVDL